jgi:hypothetical protein
MLEAALDKIPDVLRKPAIEFFEGILKDHMHLHYEGVGTKAGKLCETVYCILEGAISGTYRTSPSKPENFVRDCQAFEKQSSAIDRSFRIQIPKVLIAIYEMRNNRAIGHVHGVISPNAMDSEFMVRSAKWVMAELVRLFAGSNSAQASKIIESITINNFPAVWEVNGQKRVLDPKMPHPERVLVLSYSEPNAITAKTLCGWSRHSNLSTFRKTVLKKLDDACFINFDETNDLVTISPIGRREVEKRKLLGRA